MRSAKQLATALLGAAFFGMASVCSAWDNPGHMAVAGLAYDELTPAQQVRLVAILKQHPGMELITRGFPDGSPDGRTLVMAAATWPDLAKNGKDLGYVDTGYEASSPAVDSVTFDHKMHKGWHFIDTPIWVGTGPAQALPTTPKVNAVGVVNVLKSQLQSNEGDEARAYDLAWLEHLVGDLHQPLHAVTGVSETFPKGDVGGNDVKVEGDTKGERELHAYWDDALGKTAHADKTTHLPRLDKDILTADDIIVSINHLPLAADSDNLDPAAWAAESCKMAKEDVYNITMQEVSGDKGDELVANLDDTYNQTTVDDAKQRIRSAGHRLALLLKQELQ